MSNSEALRAALSALLERYTALVNSGDAGNWNPEEEAPVIAARAALAQPAADDRWNEGYKHGLWQGRNCAQPAASGEPVAWRWAPSKAWPSDYVMTSLKDRAESAARHGIEVTPLYAAQPAPALVPPGWVLVPVEPTPEMQWAGVTGLDAASHSDIDPTLEEVAACYRAMVAAAPDAQKGEA